MFSCLVGLVPAHSDSRSILIIKSSDNPFFNSSIEQLSNHTQSQVKFNITTLESIRQKNTTDYQPDIIITLGIAAAKFSLNFSKGIPVVHSYITEFQYKNNTSCKGHYSLLLDQPLERYLQFIKLLLNVNTVGIIKSDKDKISADRLDKIKKSTTIDIKQSIFESGDNPVNSVRNLLQNADVLLSLPAPEVYYRQSLKGILLSSYRLNKPVISYSPSHVKSGALAAIYASPENIGTQLAEILNKMLESKTYQPESFYYAQNFNIVFNKRVSESLHIKLPDKQLVAEKLKQASEK